MISCMLYNIDVSASQKEGMYTCIRESIHRSILITVLSSSSSSVSWTVTRIEEGLLEITEMRMLWWILGVSLMDKKRNQVTRKMLGVACITDKIQEARLRWHGHVMRREDENSMKRTMTAEVNGRRSRGRQKKRWGDMMQLDKKYLRLKKEHYGDRKKWRGRIQVADPSPGRD